MYLSKEQILAAQDVRFEEVDAPLWGGKVRIRSMTGADRDAFEQFLVDNRIQDQANLKLLKAKMCSLCIVDENGERIFSDADLEALNAKSADQLDVVCKRIDAINALTREALEGLVKNSAPGPADSTT